MRADAAAGGQYGGVYRGYVIHVGNQRVPARLKALNSTSSLRKSVCLAMTVMPFDSVHRTASIDPMRSSSTMLPGVGSVARSGTSSKVSAYGSTTSASAPSSLRLQRRGQHITTAGVDGLGPEHEQDRVPGLGPGRRDVIDIRQRDLGQ